MKTLKILVLVILITLSSIGGYAIYNNLLFFSSNSSFPKNCDMNSEGHVFLGWEISGEENRIEKDTSKEYILVKYSQTCDKCKLRDMKFIKFYTPE